MKNLIVAITLAVLAAPTVADAACFADYKAKKDAPLRLHYGVAEISGTCSVQAASRVLQSRLSAQGWTLLNVISVFDESGLEARKDSAGANFLRY